MKLLLDTHLLLWSVGFEPDERSPMPAKAAAMVDDESNELYFSSASIWEVAIKTGRGHDDFKADPRALRRGLLDNNYLEVPITGEHAAAVADLPKLHRDPFDRLLIAQARSEGLILLTADAKVIEYGRSIERGF